jgi:hypothetical protein
LHLDPKYDTIEEHCSSSSPEQSHHEREIKPAISIKSKLRKKIVPSTPFIEQFSVALNGFWARNLSFRSNNPDATKEAQEIKSTLTAELVASALKTQATLATENQRDVLTINERVDFFLQTPTLDNQYHQVIICNILVFDWIKCPFWVLEQQRYDVPHNQVVGGRRSRQYLM